MPNPSHPRLAIITHEYYPVLCGGSVMAQKMAVEYSKLGYNVEILTCGVGRNYPALEVHEHFKVRRFWTARSSMSDAKFLEHVTYVVLGLPQMIVYLFRGRFDLLFSIFAIPSGFMAIFLAKLYKIPSFVFVDAADVPGVESARSRLVRILTPLFRFVTRRSSGVIVLAGLEALAKPHIKNPHVIVIPNGTTLPSKCADPGRKKDRIELLSIGRLVSRKGFQDIIRALAQVREKRGDFHMTIIGYGSGEADIKMVLAEHKIEKHISMIGRVNYEQLAQYYLSSDCYLFYGGLEGSSLAMIEAVSYGLPIIASDHPGNRTYVEGGRNGFLVEHGNPAILADAVLQILANRDKLQDWGRESVEIAKHYSWEKIALRYHEFFEQVIKENYPVQSPEN